MKHIKDEQSAKSAAIAPYLISIAVTVLVMSYAIGWMAGFIVLEHINKTFESIPTQNAVDFAQWVANTIFAFSVVVNSVLVLIHKRLHVWLSE